MSQGYKSQPSGDVDVAAVIADLRARVGAQSDSELASKLGVKRSAVSHWKMRGSVPKSALLKVSAIELAEQRHGRFATYLSSLPDDVIFFGKALAVLYCAKSSMYRHEGETLTDPERLRSAVVSLEELSAAGAFLIANAKAASAWDAFAKLANSQFLIQDLKETAMLGRMAHLTDDALKDRS